MKLDAEAARKNLAARNTPTLISSLKVLGNEGALTDLQSILIHTKSENAAVQRTAVAACCSIIRGKLLADFNALEPALRQKLGAIMESLHPAVVEEIAEDIFGDDEAVRLRAVQILGLLRKNPKTRDILARLVTDRDEKIRATAINLLGKLIGPNDHELIMSLLGDKDKRVRANTIEALESLGNKRVVPVLLRFRHDPNNRIRGNVLKALHTLGHTEIGPHLLEMVNSGDDFMAASALWVVGKVKIAGKKIEDTAAKCAVSDNEMVAINAVNALRSMDTPRARGYVKYLDLDEILPAKSM